MCKGTSRIRLRQILSTNRRFHSANFSKPRAFTRNAMLLMGRQAENESIDGSEHTLPELAWLHPVLALELRGEVVGGGEVELIGDVLDAQVGC